jgi:hypothetical protein
MTNNSLRERALHAYHRKTTLQEQDAAQQLEHRREGLLRPLLWQTLGIPWSQLDPPPDGAPDEVSLAQPLASVDGIGFTAITAEEMGGVFGATGALARDTLAAVLKCSLCTEPTMVPVPNIEALGGALQAAIDGQFICATCYAKANIDSPTTTTNDDLPVARTAEAELAAALNRFFVEIVLPGHQAIEIAQPAQLVPNPEAT